MADDGIGVQAIWELERQSSCQTGSSCWTAAPLSRPWPDSWQVFHKLIIVDAVHGGALPGRSLDSSLRISWAKGADQSVRPDPGPVSLHDVGVIETLMLERLAESTSPGRAGNARTQSTVFIGIEPAQVEPSWSSRRP